MQQLTLALHVTPAAARDEIVGWQNTATDCEGKALKIRLHAPAQDGKANKALITFLAKYWKIPKQSLTLVSGETSRHKRIKISGESNIQQVIAALPHAE